VRRKLFSVDIRPGNPGREGLEYYPPQLWTTLGSAPGKCSPGRMDAGCQGDCRVNGQRDKTFISRVRRGGIDAIPCLRRGWPDPRAAVRGLRFRAAKQSHRRPAANAVKPGPRFTDVQPVHRHVRPRRAEPRWTRSASVSCARRRTLDAVHPWRAGDRDARPAARQRTCGAPGRRGTAVASSPRAATGPDTSTHRPTWHAEPGCQTSAFAHCRSPHEQ